MNLEGRNEIRFNNAGGRCLLENWVEERATNHLEEQDINRDDVNCAQMLKDGHKCLLTQSNKGPGVSGETTNRSSFKKPEFPRVATQGKMYTKDLDEYVNDIKNQKLNEIKLQNSKMPMVKKSVKQSDFDKEDFVFTPPKPVNTHDLYNENQLSFWTDNPEKIHGKSQTGVANNPFRKNAAFTKPYNEYHGERLPHGIDNN